MAASLVSAEDMRRAVAGDPQFRCPRWPKLCQGLVLLPLADRLLAEGGPTRQVLRGTAARDLVPAVLPLLDGTRDAAGIAERAGLTRGQVEQILALLYTCGLIEEGDDTTEAPGTPASAFWSRSLDSTRVNVSESQVWRRLAAAKVAVTGEAALAALISAELAAAGLTGAAAAAPLASSAGYDLVLGAASDGPASEDAGEAPDALAVAAEACRVAGVPFLPVRITGDTFELGPYIDPEFTATYQEAERQRRAAPPPCAAARLPAPLRQRLAAAMCAAQAVGLITRIGSVPALRGLMRVDLASWEQHLHVVAPCPPRPGPRVTTTAAGVPLALVFETSVAFPPRQLLNPRAHQVHYKPGNLALQFETKRWPSAPEEDLAGRTAVPATPLPGVEGASAGEWPSPAGFSGPVPLAELAAVLERGAARRSSEEPVDQAAPGGPPRGGKLQRWAPTGGNLGSVQPHVLARHVAGLRPGIWGYVSGHHRLARLSDVTGPGLGDALDTAAAVIILTGALARVASKYHGFAWRVIHLDAGVALAQMSATAAAFGLRARPLARWDDSQLADLLDLELDSEPVTGVLLVGGGPGEER